MYSDAELKRKNNDKSIHMGEHVLNIDLTQVEMKSNDMS